MIIKSASDTDFTNEIFETMHGLLSESPLEAEEGVDSEDETKSDDNDDKEDLQKDLEKRFDKLEKELEECEESLKELDKAMSEKLARLIKYIRVVRG